MVKSPHDRIIERQIRMLLNLQCFHSSNPTRVYESKWDLSISDLHPMISVCYSTESKIAALEAKLKQLEDSSDSPGVNPKALNLQHPLPAKPISVPASFLASSSSTPRDSASSRNNGSRGSKTPASLGKKPTLEELMKSGRMSGLGGITKR